MIENKSIDQIINSSQLIIYGAGIIGRSVLKCLTNKPYNLSIDKFMVSDKKNNLAEIQGIQVIDVQEGLPYKETATILIAVIDKYYQEIYELLQQNGYKNIISLTFESDLWSQIRENYYKEIRDSQGKPYLTIEQELKQVNISNCDCSDVHIYMAKCHVDRKLNVDFTQYDWEIPIQVGAALTDEIIADIRDNTGENISNKNREYCELTALYWIWKNDNSKYAGLCHYRRHYCLNRDLLGKLAQSDIDVVLTIPVLNFPDVRAMYANDHIEQDWDIMLEAINILHPEYYGTADTVQKGIYYYAYNMFIARKEIFDDYCSWLFPILAYCEEKCGRKEDKYQNRCIGFLAERLLTIYFMYHEDEYKIVHVQKEFLI